MSCPYCQNKLGTVGASLPTPYVIDARCYEMPTDRYPQAGGFAKELDEHLSECEYCTESAATMCENEYQDCVSAGLIPAGVSIDDVTPEMLSACRDSCKGYWINTMLAAHCPPKVTPPQPTTPGPGTTQPTTPGTTQPATPPVTPIGYDQSAKKSSAVPWFIGGFAAVLGIAAVVHLTAPKPNPVCRATRHRTSR